MHRDTVIEIWAESLAPLQGLEKISESRDKRVLVSNRVARLPEILGIRMIWTSHQQVAARLQVGCLRGIKKFQSIHILEIELEHPLGTVDLKRIAIAAAHAVASCLSISLTAHRQTHQQHG